MPITDAEWTDGRIDPTAERPDPAPADGETPRERVEQFLRANDGLAFSRAEVVRGAAARSGVAPATLGQTLAALPNQLADLRADFEAGNIAVDVLSTSLDDLRDAGAVTCRRIDRSDGERAVYYRFVG